MEDQEEETIQKGPQRDTSHTPTYSLLDDNSYGFEAPFARSRRI
ncbi:uncharacterized protein G2W53_004949 [Senna tora]|uniref:Uncharacterized protein n=1 Tax=Senna tora TaxID=362788 RepID=A0A835CGY1_9FABA|nr:uncharacterized protein G2W53_004949 [Senna tora]